MIKTSPATQKTFIIQPPFVFAKWWLVDRRVVPKELLTNSMGEEDIINKVQCYNFLILNKCDQPLMINYLLYFANDSNQHKI